MKAIVFILFFCLFSNPFVLSAQERPDTAGTAAIFQNIMSQINPRHKRWIQATVNEAKERNLSIDEIGNKAAIYTSSLGLSENEQEFFIGMAAMLLADDISKDIKLMESNLNTLKEQKRELLKAINRQQDKYQQETTQQQDSLKLKSEHSRYLLPQANSNRARIVSQDTAKTVKTERLRQPATQAVNDKQVIQMKQPATQAVNEKQVIQRRQPSTQAVNDKQLIQIGDPAAHDIIDKEALQMEYDLNSIDEMSEMESLNLQMLMDRRSKMMNTLSNLLKKVSDTSQSIIQNMK